MLETVKHTEEAEKFHLAFLKMLLGREFYFFTISLICCYKDKNI